MQPKKPALLRRHFTGHAPNYVKVYAKGENLSNEIRSVRITGLFRDGILGEILN